MWSSAGAVFFGFDYSLTSPGVTVRGVWREPDGTLRTVDRFGYFAKRRLTDHGKFEWLGDASAFSGLPDHERHHAVAESAISARFLVPALREWRTHVGIEGYSFGSRGFHFQTGEAVGVLKEKLRVLGLADDIHRPPPQLVKKLATGKGTAKKPEVVAAFKDRTGFDLPEIFGVAADKNPVSDVADSYFVMEAVYNSVGIDRI